MACAYSWNSTLRQDPENLSLEATMSLAAFGQGHIVQDGLGVSPNPAHEQRKGHFRCLGRHQYATPYERDFVSLVHGGLTVARHRDEDLVEGHIRHEFLPQGLKTHPVPLMGSTRGEPSACT